MEKSYSIKLYLEDGEKYETDCVSAEKALEWAKRAKQANDVFVIHEWENNEGEEISFKELSNRASK